MPRNPNPALNKAATVIGSIESNTLPPGTATPSSESDLLAQAQAEIAELRAKLAAQETMEPLAPNSEAIKAQLLDTLLDRLQPTRRSSVDFYGGATDPKSTTLPCPPLLTDGKEPEFTSWKIQMQDKLRVNSDHFHSLDSELAYVFSRTAGDAQAHLLPRYASSSVERFTDAPDMLSHLATIFEDPFRTANARYEYKNLAMKTTERFPAFHTRFLHLAGEARIPTDDLTPDLFDKLTLKLQRALLPVLPTLTSVKELADRCASTDQWLHRIDDRAERFRTRNGPANATAPPVRNTTPTPAVTRAATPAIAPGNTTAPRSRTPTDRVRPVYESAEKQRLSNLGACFTCKQTGHFSRDCPRKGAVVNESEPARPVTDELSGKESP